MLLSPSWLIVSGIFIGFLRYVATYMTQLSNIDGPLSLQEPDRQYAMEPPIQTEKHSQWEGPANI